MSMVQAGYAEPGADLELLGDKDQLCKPGPQCVLHKTKALTLILERGQFVAGLCAAVGPE